MREVADGLYVGRFGDAMNRSDEVDAVLNVGHSCSNKKIASDVDYYHIPLEDSSEISMRRMRRAISIATDLWIEHEKVLIHCEAGQSRSVVVAAALLANEEGMDYFDAVEKCQDGKIEPSDSVKLTGADLV